MAQKWRAQYRLESSGNSSWSRRELLPLRRFTRSPDFWEGRYSICMCPWSLLINPLNKPYIGATDLNSSKTEYLPKCEKQISKPLSPEEFEHGTSTNKILIF